MIQEFPRVLQYLFDNAFDESKGELRRATFTFADVREAISRTRSNLHWVRGDTFLAEVARSRRVTDMLASVLEAGYSILPLEGSHAIGQFVPRGTPGTIEDRSTLGVRMKSIHLAHRVPVAPIQFRNLKKSVASFLSRPDVANPLWGGAGSARNRG